MAYHYEELVHGIAAEDSIQGAVTAAELGQALGQFMNAIKGVVDTEAVTTYFTPVAYLRMTAGDD